MCFRTIMENRINKLTHEHRVLGNRLDHMEMSTEEQDNILIRRRALDKRMKKIAKLLARFPQRRGK
jgi:hypothetical protein